MKSDPYTIDDQIYRENNMKKKHDWIIACDGSNFDYPFGFACLRCGEKEIIKQDLPIDVYLKWGEMFVKIHESCKEK